MAAKSATGHVAKLTVHFVEWLYTLLETVCISHARQMQFPCYLMIFFKTIMEIMQNQFE